MMNREVTRVEKASVKLSRLVKKEEVCVMGSTLHCGRKQVWLAGTRSLVPLGASSWISDTSLRHSKSINTRVDVLFVIDCARTGMGWGVTRRIGLD